MGTFGSISSMYYANPFGQSMPIGGSFGDSFGNPFSFSPSVFGGTGPGFMNFSTPFSSPFNPFSSFGNFGNMGFGSSMPFSSPFGSNFDSLFSSNFGSSLSSPFGSPFDSPFSSFSGFNFAPQFDMFKNFNFFNFMNRGRRSISHDYSNEPAGNAKKLVYKNRLSNAARQKISQIEDRLNLEKGSLEKVIYIESGGNPKARNGSSGATGLIQFIPSTARKFGTTTSALYNMSTEEQLDYVEKYFVRTKRDAGYSSDQKLSNAEVYGLVLMPGIIRKDSGYKKGSGSYDGNSWLDVNKNGVINGYDLQKVMDSVKIIYS